MSLKDTEAMPERLEPSEAEVRRAVLGGDSELASLMRAHPWEKTPLGPVRTWPQSLRTSVSLILNSQHPMWIGWGDAMTFLYNDAYIEVLSHAKHPWALGRPAHEVWAEIWDICGPLAEAVFQRGEATFMDEVRLFMNRGDYLEETYYSFSYSAIRDDSGKVIGLFCPSAEVTGKVLNARRLRSLSELSSSAFIEKTVESACQSAGRTLSKNLDDIPFSLLYLLSSDGEDLDLKANSGIERPFAEKTFSFGKTPAASGIEKAVVDALGSGQAQLIDVSHIEGLPLGPAQQTVQQAMVLPIVSRAEDRAIGVLIAAVNPTRKLDQEYQTFFALMAGHVATAIANARGYEEERRRTEALTELDRAKTTFYSNVSHEFRTPLTLLLGPLEEILAKGPQEVFPANRRLVEVAHRNATRLLKLVNTLLDFSRIEAGRVNVSYEPVDLSAFTADLASLFRSATEGAGLQLIIDCEPLPHAVYVDREMWEKIVLNLLSNAFKFTFDGSITVRVEDRGDGAELTVQDTGVGIPAADLPRVFERFHRVEGTRGRSFEGSGIGLALVQELAKLHGGAISAESELGKGTSFHLRLPYGSAHLPADHVATVARRNMSGSAATPYLAEALSWVATPAAELEDARLVEELAATVARGEVPLILLADDNRDMRHYVERLLGSHFRVRTAKNGREALEIALSETPDVVLSDVMMPELDGFELLAALRRHPATTTVPFILLSARAGEEARIEGLQHGADDYLVKPFSARELVARVESNLALSRLRRDTEKKIRENEERLRALVTASSEMVYRISPDWKEMRPILGQDFTEATEPLPPDWLTRYIHAEDQPRVQAAIAEAMRTHSKFSIEHRSVRPDGSIGWIQSRAVPIFNADGELIEWFGAATDITARKQSEEALLRSEKLASVGRMAATIAHEINNPLEAITNSLFLAQTTPNLPEAARQFLEMAESELKRVAHITRQSLGFYRENNAPKLTSVNDVLESTVELLKSRIRNKGVVVERQWDSNVQAVAVAGELRQVFSNLLANSLDAIDENGVIKLRVSSQTAPSNGHRMVRVTIADNGRGIRQDQLSHMFEAFFTTKGNVGTGLGLWVSKQIIDKHGGRIRLRSCTEGPRRGTAFTISIPVEPQLSNDSIAHEGRMI